MAGAASDPFAADALICGDVNLPAVRALLDALATILPAERNVHDEIEGPERLAAWL